MYLFFHCLHSTILSYSFVQKKYSIEFRPALRKSISFFTTWTKNNFTFTVLNNTIAKIHFGTILCPREHTRWRKKSIFLGLTNVLPSIYIKYLIILHCYAYCLWNPQIQQFQIRCRLQLHAVHN